MTGTLPRQALQYRWLIFGILSIGYILVFFHRLCPAVVAVDMMHDLHASGALIGLLSSAYFYPYALMQIPTGLLSDSWGPRRTISLFLIIACAGSVLLAMASSPFWAVTGRVLVGLGVSTLFVCTLKILSQWFHAREFASMTGLFMALGGLGSLAAAGPLSYLSSRIGWRTSFLLVGGLTLLVALLVWLFVRDKPEEFRQEDIVRHSEPSSAPRSLAKGIRTVLVRAGFLALCDLVLFQQRNLFFLRRPLGRTLPDACLWDQQGETGNILSFSAIGLMVGSPLVSYLSNRVFRRRKPVLVLSSIMALCLTAALAFATAELPHPALYLISFGFGATTGSAVVIAFTAVKELFPLQIAGTATGLVNLFPFAGGAALQPILGVILERNGRVAETFTTTGYAEAFFILFLCGFLACTCSFFIRETFVQHPAAKVPTTEIPISSEPCIRPQQQKIREQSAGDPRNAPHWKSLHHSFPSAAAMQSLRFSEHEPSHPDVQEYTKTYHGGNHGCPAIGKQRERHTDHRKESDHHADINNYMPEEHGRHPHRQKAAEVVVASAGDVEAPEDKDQVEKQHDQASGKTPLLGKNGKGKIRVLFGKKAELSLCSLHEAFPDQSS